MDKFEKDNNITSGKGEHDVKWITTKNGEHVPIEDGQTVEEAINNHFKKETQLYRKGLTKKTKRDIVYLDKKEYAKFCGAIRTMYADKIPQKGHVFLDNTICSFHYDKRSERIVCTKQVRIVGNEDVINEILRRENGINKKRK